MHQHLLTQTSAYIRPGHLFRGQGYWQLNLCTPALPFRPAAVLADLVKKHLQPQGLDAEHWPQPRVHQLLLSSDLTHMLQATHGSSTQGSLCASGSDAAAARLCFQPENPNPANSNSAACYVCQASVHAGCPNLCVGRLAAQAAYRPQDLCPARTLLTNDVCLRHVCTAFCCDPVCRWVRGHPATSGARCCWSCWCRWRPSPASTHCAQCSAWATPLVSAGHSLAGSHMCVASCPVLCHMTYVVLVADPWTLCLGLQAASCIGCMVCWALWFECSQPTTLPVTCGSASHSGCLTSGRSCRSCRRSACSTSRQGQGRRLLGLTNSFDLLHAFRGPLPVLMRQGLRLCGCVCCVGLNG